jgi:hypothetical protein
VWRRIIDERFTGPYILQENVADGNYANFMHNELSAFLEDLLLQTNVLQHHAVPVQAAS